MTRARRRLPLSLLLVVASVPVVAGCGGGSGSASSTMATQTAAPSGAPTKSAVKVDISNFAYDPDPVTVKAGGKITWTNQDPDEHTATADDGKTFDTGTLEKGDSKTVTFTKPGTYTYVCSFHAFMHGTVVVK
jgi:plastocyanin